MPAVGIELLQNGSCNFLQTVCNRKHTNVSTWGVRTGLLAGMMGILAITVGGFYLLFRLHNKAGGGAAVLREMADFGAHDRRVLKPGWHAKVLLMCDQCVGMQLNA